jgi:hypothetical protein
MRCAFCLREPPGVPLSDEHVFPESMGGMFTVRFVCKGCNDTLGSDVDALLTEYPLIQMLRMGLHIPNKSGELPAALKDGEIVGHPGVVASYVAKVPGEKGVVKPRPKVIRFTTPDGRSFVNVEGQADEARRIIEKIEKRHIEKGGMVKNRESYSRRIESPTVKKTVKTNDRVVVRPLLKIAYELGIHALGYQYVGDPRAILLRRGIQDGVFTGIEGEISFLPERSAFNAPDIPSYCHLGAVWLAGERAWCSVRVFNVLEAVVLLSEKATSYDARERLIVLDPLARERFEHTPESRPVMTFGNLNTGIRWQRSADNPGEMVVTVAYNGIEDTTITLNFGPTQA